VNGAAAPKKPQIQRRDIAVINIAFITGENEKKKRRVSFRFETF